MQQRNVPHLRDALRIQKSKDGSRNERRSLLPHNELLRTTAGSFFFEKKRATEQREGRGKCDTAASRSSTVAVEYVRQEKEPHQRCKMQNDAQSSRRRGEQTQLQHRKMMMRRRGSKHTHIETAVLPSMRVENERRDEEKSGKRGVREFKKPPHMKQKTESMCASMIVGSKTLFPSFLNREPRKASLTFHRNRFFTERKRCNAEEEEERAAQHRETDCYSGIKAKSVWGSKIFVGESTIV